MVLRKICKVIWGQIEFEIIWPVFIHKNFIKNIARIPIFWSLERHDTIFGLADTDDPEQLKLALDLADQYELDKFTIHTSFMENFILTAPVDSITSQSLAQFEPLSHDKRFFARLETYCWPNIKGNDHARILAYFR